MTNINWLYVAIAALVLGALLLLITNKQRDENGEWKGGLETGYLLLIAGVGGVLSLGFGWSITASMLLLTVVCGAAWLWRKLAFKADAENAQDNNHFREHVGGFFPLLGVIFVVRTFIIEPFVIPSSSMRPGLTKGDLIVVNKFAYGIRVPVQNNVLIPTGNVERGDVVVFNYPLEPGQNFIKRLVAVPGDVIEYKDKVLTVNGVAEQDTPAGMYRYADDLRPEQQNETDRFHAGFAGKAFDVLKVEGAPAVHAGTWHHYQDAIEQAGMESGLAEHCEYAPDGSSFKCTVPQGKYFAMGDNRDHSADSRYWGFVDDKLVVGKAFMVALNFGDFGRIGTRIQ